MYTTHTALKDRNVVQLTSDLLSQYPEIEDALQLAAYAHDGQVRKEIRDGAEHRDPYVIHPIRLALRIARWGMFNAGPGVRLTAMRVALLHDVPEDASERMLRYLELGSAMDPQEALSLAFGAEVGTDVSRLTNPILAEGEDKNQSYVAHILNTVMPHLVPLVVKASDLVDNAGSLKHMPATDKRLSLATKYIHPARHVAQALGRVPREMPAGLDYDYTFVRGMHRAETRMNQVVAELHEIIEKRPS